MWLSACDCLQVLGDHELEPMSKSLLAAPHSMCELRALLCKTVISVADILFKPLPHLQTVLYVLACGLIFYYHARMVSPGVPATCSVGQCSMGSHHQPCTLLADCACLQQ